MGERILITGMGGVIGRQLATVAVDQDYKVFGTVNCNIPNEVSSLARYERITCFKADLREYSQTREVISIAQPDIIINLAGHPHSDPVLGKAVFDENMAILNNLAFSALSSEKGRNRFSNPLTFIQAGTIWQYGQSLGEIPITEIPYTELPCQDSNYYAQSKLAAEELLMTLYQGGLPIAPILLRLAHHAGEGKTDGMTAVAAEAVSRVKRGEDDCIRIRNKIGKIDLSHAFDGARAISFLIREGIPGEAYNVARGEDNTIEEILSIMAGRLNLPSSVEIVSTGEEIQTHARFNVAKLLSTGFRPLLSITQTVERFLNWYYQQGTSFSRTLSMNESRGKVAFA